eukprot:7379100-Ditylum_brightwellii.AAC.1
MDVIARATPSATFMDICKLCNSKPAQLTPDSNTCAANFLGKCVSPHCTCQHRVATDVEAEHITKSLEHAIKNPERQCTQGQS